MVDNPSLIENPVPSGRNMNGDDVNVFHMEPGHTDGDAVIFFKKANMIHMGD